MPVEDSKENYLRAFWEWVSLMADDHYARAIEALYWQSEPWLTPGELKKQITTFWGGDEPWSVVIPNDRWIKVIEDKADVEFSQGKQPGWFMAQVPVTAEPNRARDEDAPLQGVAASFMVRQFKDSKVLEFEIFHL